MRSIQRLSLVAFCCSATVNAVSVAAQQLPNLKRPDDLPRFITFYYQHPRPDLIGRAIELLPSSEIVRPGAMFPTLSFFSEVFSANPEKMPEWQSLIDKQDEGTKALLAQAVGWSKSGGVTALAGASPMLNDAVWAAFFATGNASFVERLVGELKYDDERDDFKLWQAGASAKWSLASNARQHPLVKTILESQRTTADKRTQELIDEALKRDPADIRREWQTTIQKQRAAGKW